MGYSINDIKLKVTYYSRVSTDHLEQQNSLTNQTTYFEKMIKNNKGFMLIEVIITSTIVLTTLIALYASFNKLYNNYRIKNNYHNLDATYATKEIINSMLKNDEGNINNYINTIIPNSKYGYIIKNGYCTNEAEFNNNGTPAATVPNNCSNIKKLYTIK
jgi:Tfp pilus assembly protein PilE